MGNVEYPSIVERITASRSFVPTFLYTKLSAPASRVCRTKVMSGMPVMTTTRTRGQRSFTCRAATMPLESLSVQTSMRMQSGCARSTTPVTSAASARTETTSMSGWASTAMVRESRSIAWSSTIMILITVHHPPRQSRQYRSLIIT